MKVLKLFPCLLVILLPLSILGKYNIPIDMRMGVIIVIWLLMFRQAVKIYLSILKLDQKEKHGVSEMVVN